MNQCLAEWFVRPDLRATCEREATVCSECIRAFAFQWWGAIARHHADGPRCQLCEIGRADYCGLHAIEAVVEHRRMLRQQGSQLGEPARMGFR